MAKTELTDAEAQLRKLTKINPKKNEDRQDYLARLQSAVDELDDDVWDDLSDAAQKWANDAAEASKKNKVMPDFGPGAGDEGDEDEAPKAKKGKKAKKDVKAKKGKARDEDDEDDEDEAPKAKKGKKAKKDVKAKKDDDSDKRPRDFKERIKLALIETPTLSVAEIQAVLQEQGRDMPSRSTIAGIGSEFRHSLRVLKKAGKLRGIQL